MKGITYCGACADYDIKKHRCKRGAKLESNPQDKFFDDCPLPTTVQVVRCKDCKHHYDCGIHFCDRLGMDCPDDSDFFCSYGVRKDGGVERLLSTSTW